MPRSRKKAIRQPLSRERIEKAALKVIELDGLEAFSIRRLAAELGCEAMSIYHHFPSKQHLMDGLVDRVLATTPPVPLDLPPIERLRRRCFNARAMAHRFPRFYPYLAVHRMNTPGGIRWIGDILDNVFELGGDAETTARIFRAVGYYLTGASLDETSGYAKGPSAAVPVPDEVVVRDYPALVAVNRYFKSDQHEKTFVLGLDILLEGAKEMVRASRANSPGKARGAPARRSAPPSRP